MNMSKLPIPALASVFLLTACGSDNNDDPVVTPDPIGGIGPAPGVIPEPVDPVEPVLETFESDANGIRFNPALPDQQISVVGFSRVDIAVRLADRVNDALNIIRLGELRDIFDGFGTGEGTVEFGCAVSGGLRSTRDNGNVSFEFDNCLSDDLFLNGTYVFTENVTDGTDSSTAEEFEDWNVSFAFLTPDDLIDDRLDVIGTIERERVNGLEENECGFVDFSLNSNANFELYDDWPTLLENMTNETIVTLVGRDADGSCLDADPRLLVAFEQGGRISSYQGDIEDPNNMPTAVIVEAGRSGSLFDGEPLFDVQMALDMVDMNLTGGDLDGRLIVISNERGQGSATDFNTGEPVSFDFDFLNFLN